MNIAQSDALIDYFFVCGLNYNTGLETLDLTSDPDSKKILHCISPLDRSYKSTILQKFPENRESLPYIGDDCINSLCMPDGLKLFTTGTVLPHPINHNFIITREDGSRIYGTSLLFAEEIDNDDVKRSMIDLQNIYLLDHPTSIDRRSYCINCQNVRPDVVDDSGCATEFSCEDEKLYVLKAIGVLSQHSYIQCHQSWLFDIWLMVAYPDRLKLSKLASLAQLEKQDIDQKENSLSFESMTCIESYVSNILFDIKTPDHGKTVAIDGPSMRHYCRCPDANELPTFELPIRGLLEVLGLENFIRVYLCVMLEFRVVIMSKDERLLMLVAECITTLLFPFVWSHVYAPILPLAARDFLNAPVPFIMGIKLSTKGDEETIQLASDASVCYVNVDEQTVTTSDDIPTFPYLSDLRREITEILVHSIKDSSLNANQRQSSHSTFDTVKMDVSDIENCVSTKDSFCNEDRFSMRLMNDSIKIESSFSHVSANSKNSITSSRLPKEAEICIVDILEPILRIDDCLSRSEMMAKKYCNMLKSNKVFRELFFNHFLHIFDDYEQFIIHPKGDTTISDYYLERESNGQTFDKAGFLSEQPETHLTFLSAFLETQMFASFIDMKIVSAWESAHPNLVLFERNLRKMQHRIKNQLNISHRGDINFKPYFKSAKLIELVDKEFEEHLFTMINLRPSNNEGQWVTTQNSISRVGQFGTNFPVLHDDILRVEPRRKLPVKKFDMKVISFSQDLEFNNNQSIPNGKLYKTPDVNVVGSKTRTLGRTMKVKENLDSLPTLSFIVPGVTAQNHATFVKTLLQESKAKTKRIILEKMGGQEAVELGHGDRFVSGIEENTLVACLCDLLERMWCHGLIGAHGKSALWSHLTKFVERDRETSIIKQTNKDKVKQSNISKKGGKSRHDLVKDALKSLDVDPYCLFRYFNEVSQNEDLVAEKSESHDKNRNNPPDFIMKALGTPQKGEFNIFLNWDVGIPGPRDSNSSRSSKQIDLSTIFGSQCHDLVSDVEAIKSLSDIKTDISLARAFVRLALEKKLLNEHLKNLLSDTNLLRELYARHAFLRCETECEQFLFHLLALQAVDYYSFTNLYINCQLVYRMFIHTGQRFSPGNGTSANAWFCVNGQHGSTGVISIPKDGNKFDFKNQNLGILTTMKIGHDNAGLSPKWFIDFILIQNQITGQVYKFACSRSLGKNADDGSLERLLIGELVRLDDEDIFDENSRKNKFTFEKQTSPRSQSLTRQQSTGKVVDNVSWIQEQIGNAVNNLVKYFCRQQDREKITVNNISGSCNVTVLLCGEGGLVGCLDQVFMYGFRSPGFLQKKLFPWDYLEKVARELEHNLNCRGKCMDKTSNGKCSTEWSVLVSDSRITQTQQFCKIINKIANVNHSIGKEGKFQIFVCICVRDHLFPEIIELFGLIDCTKRYYDESGFFLDPQLREVLINVMSSLNEFTVPLDLVLTDSL